MTRPVHPNVIANHRFRWKQENGREYPGDDKSITDIVEMNDFTCESSSEEDDAVQKDMTDHVNGVDF